MKTIGIIAGNGRFPILTAKEARAQGYRVVVSGIEEETDPRLEKIVDAFRWVKVGQLKKMSKFFRAEGVHEAVMNGKVEKARLFQSNVRPDLDMVRVLMKNKDNKDDSLLSGIANYLHEQGIDLLDSTLFIQDHLPGSGVLGKKKPSKETMGDIEFGFEMAKAIAGIDAGQTVVVKKRAIMALEAIEGTDLAIRRGGRLGGSKVTVVKVAKPEQDMRFDVPTVGMKTLKELISVKASAFAFEAGKTIFLEKEEFIPEADRHGIALFGIQKNV